MRARHTLILLVSCPDLVTTFAFCAISRKRLLLDAPLHASSMMLQHSDFPSTDLALVALSLYR
jgi:hypothetical protein